MHYALSIIFLCVSVVAASAARAADKFSQYDVWVGATNEKEYLPLLQNKRIGLVAHQASRIGKAHVLDILLSKKLKVVRIFAPEHGFRTDADAGELVQDGIDKKTGIPIVSLYNNIKKPTSKQFNRLDAIVLDLQDVGVRCYTYLSTLHYVMETCAENNISLVIFDRPNPNGHFVDGPVLEPRFHSFVGMHPIPMVHGMTLGELAKMINGERWLRNGRQCKLNIVACRNYTHNTPYHLPVAPSPNLPNSRAVYLYPSLCFFEGTVMSVGRGTQTPFQVVGHPLWTIKKFEFTPQANNVVKKPLYKDTKCYGINLFSLDIENLYAQRKINLDYLIEAHRFFRGSLFVKFFSRLAGTGTLQQQIESDMSAAEIRASWKPDIDKFMQKRKKYLLYPDFI
jgi:uncharacterized protein YbbC (DUF1343 family)